MYVLQLLNNMIVVIIFWRTTDEEICLRNILRVFAIDNKDLFIFQPDGENDCLCLVGRRALTKGIEFDLRPGEVRFPVDHHWGSIYSWRQDVTIASALVFLGKIVDDCLILEKQIVHGFITDRESLCFKIKGEVYEHV